MNVSNVLKCIEQLSTDELDAVRNAPHKLSPIKEPSRWQALAQQLLFVPRTGVTSFSAADPGCWGCAVDRVPILRQLLIYPALIVDLRPYRREDDLISTFGLNRQQLLKLADDGRIFFNLYEYESQAKIGFRDYTISPGLEYFLKHPNCRIHSIRREAFFKSIDLPEKILKDARNEALDLFRKIIDDLVKNNPDELENLTRNRTSEGAFEVIKEAYLYIKVLGSQEEAVQRWLVKSLPESIKDVNPLKSLVELRGLKSMLATPFTAAFGGFSSYTEREIDRIVRAAPIFLRVPKEKQVLDEKVKAGLEYLQRVLVDRYSRSQALHDEVITVPEAPDERTFDNFRQLLQNQSTLQNTALGFLDSVRVNAGNNRKVLESFEGWAKTIEAVRKEYSRNQKLVVGGGAAVGGTIIYSVGTLTGGDFAFLNLVFATLGAVAGAVLTKQSDEWLVTKLLSQNKCQIIDRLQTIERWSKDYR